MEGLFYLAMFVACFVGSFVGLVKLAKRVWDGGEPIEPIESYIARKRELERK